MVGEYFMSTIPTQILKKDLDSYFFSKDDKWGPKR